MQCAAPSARPRARPAAARTLLGSFAARALLALAFLFAQQTATLHWLSHATDAVRAKAVTAPSTDHCDECLALCALDASAATGEAAPLPLVAARPALLSARAASPSPLALRLAFRSRAPPSLS